MTEWLNVGKIVNTHGIKGEVRVISNTDFADERYQVGNKLFIEFPEQSEMLEVKIKHHRQHKQFDLLQFEGYENVNDVEKFKGSQLKFQRKDIHELDEGEFYYFQIIGCEVFTEQGEHLGVIKEVLSPGANDVWVIKRPKGKDILIPYIKDVVKEVDVNEKRVLIHLMKGLL